MFLVTFYQFGKKENSTKRPTENIGDIFTTYQCMLKDSCSVLTPVLWLNVEGLPTTWNPTKWSYAYIPDFDRYYFVTDWVWEKPHWEAHLTVDPLASYRTQILASTKYVLRSASDYDPEIIDTLYSPTGKVSVQRSVHDFTLPPDMWTWDAAQNPLNGYFVVGICGTGAHAINGVTYYRFTPSELITLIQYMYINPISMQWDSTEAWNAVISKAFIDPMDYIVSAFWLPFDPYLNQLPIPQETVKFGYWTISGLTAAYLTHPYIDFQWSHTNPPNPYYINGAWELLPPFASYSLEFGPFGVIPINALRARNAGGITCTLRVDYSSGMGGLKIYDLTTGTPSAVITEASALFAVPIPIGRQRDQVLSMMGDSAATLGAGAALTGAVATGGSVAGPLAAFVSGAVAVTHDLLGQDMGRTGSMGSMCAVSTQAEYVVTYSQTQTRNDAEMGIPLCKNRLLQTLSGFTLCADGEIDLVGMYDDERRSIAKYLTSGFYIE